MRQQVALPGGLVPFGEGLGVGAILARLVVLEASLLDLVGQGIEKIVVRVMVRTEQLECLLHQRPVRFKLLGLVIHELGPIGEQVEVHRRLAGGGKLDALGEAARVQRAVDEGFEIGALVARLVATRGGGLQCRGRLPARGQAQRHGHGDLAGKIAGRIKQYRVPVDEHHLAADFGLADLGAGRRQILEVDIKCLDARIGAHPECVDVDGVARPRHRPALRGDLQAREALDRALRGVIARQPLGIQQHGIAADAAQRFMHVNDALGGIGGIHAQLDFARVGAIPRRRDRRKPGECGRAGALCRLCPGACHAQNSHDADC